MTTSYQVELFKKNYWPKIKYIISRIRLKSLLIGIKIKSKEIIASKSNFNNFGFL